MAFSAAVLDKTVYGNTRVQHLLVTTDDVTGTVDTGMSVITAAHMTPKSAASSVINLAINILAASTAAAGNFAITGATSGDDLYVTVYGR